MDQVAEVKSKVDIVSVVGEYVTLKKAGRNFSGRCPFHNEKTPSFMVSPELQIYKCFGCGEGGDVFNFIEKQEGVEFYEALQILAIRAGVELKGYDSEGAKKKNILSDINNEAIRFYHYILLSHKSGEKAKKYLLEDRKLKISTIREFKLGYAPENSPSLFYYLSKKKKFNPRDIEEAGIVFRGRNGYTDRFRGRVIYPIHDNQGKPIALAGRILPSLSGKGLAKYINSPETPIYNKSRSLFGLYKTKSEIKKLANAVIVEGEMDFLSSWQNDVKNVVAIKGTAMTQEHVNILSRFTEKLTLALDSDFAGDKAALRGITLAQNAELEVRIASMKNYKDPDEFAIADPEGYKKEIEEAEDIWEFMINSLSERFDLNSASGKAKATALLTPFLNNIENQVVKRYYLDKLSQKIGVGLDAVSRQVSKNQKRGSKTSNSKEKTSKEGDNKAKTRRELLEEEIMVLGLRFYPRELINSDISDYLENRFLARLLKVTSTYLKKNNKFDIKDFSLSLPSQISKDFQQLLLSHPQEPDDPEEDLDMAYKALVKLDTKEKINKVVSKLAKTGENEELKQKKLQRNMNKLTSKLKRLEETQKWGIIGSGD